MSSMPRPATDSGTLNPPSLRLLRHLDRQPWDHRVFEGGQKGSVIESLSLLDKIVVDQHAVIHALAKRRDMTYRSAERMLRYGGEDAAFEALRGPAERYVLDYTYNPPVDSDYPVSPGVSTYHFISIVLHRNDGRIVTRTHVRHQDDDLGRRIYSPPLLISLSPDGHGLINPEAYPESLMFRLEEIIRLALRCLKQTLFLLSLPDHRLVSLPSTDPVETIGGHAILPERFKRLTIF